LKRCVAQSRFSHRPPPFVFRFLSLYVPCVLFLALGADWMMGGGGAMCHALHLQYKTTLYQLAHSLLDRSWKRTEGKARRTRRWKSAWRARRRRPRNVPPGGREGGRLAWAKMMNEDAHSSPNWHTTRSRQLDFPFQCLFPFVVCCTSPVLSHSAYPTNP